MANGTVRDDGRDGTRGIAPTLRLMTVMTTLTLCGCISFSAKPPPTLLALTPATSRGAGPIAGGDPANALVIEPLSVPRSLATTRVPVMIDATNIAYLKNAQWVDEPSRLMRALIEEAVIAHGRLVMSDATAEGRAHDYLTGDLVHFGLDRPTMQVVVTFDAVRMTGPQVRQQRFEARVPVAAAAAGPVGQALNQAANQVAGNVAQWIAAN